MSDSEQEAVQNRPEPLKYENPILQFFSYAHLPPHLQVHSKPFCDLAKHILETLPGNPERVIALRKLLKAKDAAVRASLFKDFN